MFFLKPKPIQFIDRPWKTFIGIVLTIAAVGILSIDKRNPGVLTATTIIEVVYIGYIFFSLYRMFSLVFYKDQDYTIDVIYVIDVYLGFLLSLILITFSLWQFDLSSNKLKLFSNIGDSIPVYAYQQLFSYTLYLAATSTYTEVQPTHAVSQVWSGLMVTGSVVMHIVLVAASIALIMKKRRL